MALPTDQQPSQVGTYEKILTIANRIMHGGEITKEEMIVHPQRNLLTRAVGVEEDLHVDSGTLPVKSGDRILLCTDGLSGYISDERIREVLHHIDDNTEVLNTLIADVYDAGAGDNVTIIVGTI